jgi:hypothetical protein
VAIPAIIRDNNNIKNELAKEKTVNPTNEMRSEKSKIGFLPFESDTLPSKGEKKNCITAKDAIKTPRAAGPALNSLA